MRLNLFAAVFLGFLLFGVSTCLPGASAASPSFGHVSVGESIGTTFGGVYVSNFTSPSDLGTVTRINVYVATGGTYAKAVIYSDKNGAPDRLLAQSAEVSIEGTSGKWVNFDVSYSGSPSVVYWLGLFFASAGTYYYTSDISGKVLYSTAATEAPTTFNDGTATPGGDLSVYAEYNPSKSSSTPPQNSLWVQTILAVIAIVMIILAIVAISVFRSTKKRAKLAL